MADWFGSRSEQKWTFRRVSWDGWEELEDYGNITGGECELSALTALKASGSLDYDGGEPPDEIDAIRVYYSFTDGNGDSETVCVGTFLCEASEPEYRSVVGGVRQSGSVELFSVLKAADDKLFGAPFPVTAGTNAVEKARELAESVGLRTNGATSSYTLASDHVFAPEESYLTAVNWLLDKAGFASCYPNEFGVAQMVPYVEPSERPTSFTFTNKERSIMYPRVCESTNWREMHNVCCLTYSTDTECMNARAVNNDLNSKASLANRKRERTIVEAISELQGDTAEDRLANLKDLAKKKLADESTEIQYVRMSHLYVPLIPNAAVSIEYSGLTWVGYVTACKVRFETAVKADLEIRRFMRRDIGITVDGEITYQGVVE